MASLAPPYLPRKPTETLLYKIVQQNLETFLAYAREHYEGGLPRYVEQELRAYLACGDFSRGFMRLSCEACGHDLLVAFSCGSRSICPSCTGRRMANTAAFLVDRVVPDVPVRQYVLTLPYELRKLVAFKADVLTAVARLFVESVFARSRTRAKRNGVEAPANPHKITYDTDVIDPAGNDNAGATFDLPLRHLLAMLANGASALGGIRQSGAQRFVNPTAPVLVHLSDEVFVVADGCSLVANSSVTPAPSGRATAQSALDGHVQAQPSDAGQFRVVPAYLVRIAA